MGSGNIVWLRFFLISLCQMFIRPSCRFSISMQMYSGYFFECQNGLTDVKHKILCFRSNFFGKFWRTTSRVDLPHNSKKCGELDESLGVAKIATPNPHGRTAGTTQYIQTNYYNLDAIISVGYRVNSIQATQFRIWATNILKEYMINLI